MSRIHIEGDYYISTGSMDNSLEKRSIAKEGKNVGEEYFTSLGYFPSVSSCMRALLKLKISETTATDLKGLIADVARIETDLKQLISF